MNEEPLDVMPPKKYTAMGVETVAAVRAIRKPVTTTFHQLLKNPAWAHKPATNPMKKATGIHGHQSVGFVKIPMTKFDSAPVNAPAQGPQRAPTSTVPMLSRNTGNFSCPTM